MNRIPATQVEALVLQALRNADGPESDADDRSLIATHLDRVDIRANEIAVTLRAPRADEGGASSPHFPSDDPAGEDNLTDDADRLGSAEPAATITVPWRKTSMRRRREIIVPDAATDPRPARAETRDKLISSVATARRWLTEITAGSVTIEGIATREACSTRRVTMLLSLAFLAPSLVKAAVDGRLPRGIGVSRLFDQSAEWSRQHQMLGLRA